MAAVSFVIVSAELAQPKLTNMVAARAIGAIILLLIAFKKL
jgi:hypothetical protein